MFKAIVINKNESGYSAAYSEVSEQDLPQEDVTVKIDFSTLNYKDGLAITGKSPVVRSFPMVAGIDFAGYVESSSNPEFKAGDGVILNGWGVGERHWGGLAQMANVKADWLVPLPKAFTPKQAMSIGTAGYTAMLCVLGLEHQGVKPSDGEILVTGATGGVGSVAIAILAKLGYQVVALTGKASDTAYLKSLGATEVIDRNEFSKPGRPLDKERWAGAVDVVGGQTLANICASSKYRGVVTACGLAGGFDLPATVMPFILRGVKLIGIDSVMCPKQDRIEAWERLATDLDVSKLEAISQTIALSEACEYAQKFMDGTVKGRFVVDVSL